MSKAVISLSGGMDSSCLLVNLLGKGYDEIQAVSFNYGQRHAFELTKAKELVAFLQGKGFNIKHDVVDLTSVGKMLNSALTFTKDVPEGHYEGLEMKDTVVPNRNIMFSSIVYAVALSIGDATGENVAIALGMHAGDDAIYPDCRPASVEAAEHAFRISNWGSERVRYVTPYIHTNKEGILRDCLDKCIGLGLEFDDILSRTSTSYAPTADGKSYGKTSSDVERIEAFIAIDRVDPIEYVDGWETVKANAIAVLEAGV